MRDIELRSHFCVGPKPLILTGNILHVNAKADFGESLVELLDRNGTIIATSKPLRGDSLDIPVAWQTGGLPNTERPAILRITLSNTLRFAIWCT